MEHSRTEPVDQDPGTETAASYDVLQRLRAGGCRVTEPRRAVVEELLAGDPDHHHTTADQLVERVRARHPEIHRATVYRTLDVLLDAGVITHVHLGHGPATFHLPGRAHHHAVCNGCGRTVELPPDALDAVNRHLATEHGWQLTTQHFALSAVCNHCHPTGARR